MGAAGANTSGGGRDIAAMWRRPPLLGPSIPTLFSFFFAFELGGGDVSLAVDGNCTIRASVGGGHHGAGIIDSGRGSASGIGAVEGGSGRSGNDRTR